MTNNTVGGRLVALPWFLDFGLLYCRQDLLTKYGYSKPPDTWDELEQHAQKIMVGEQAQGRQNFYGFTFAGRPMEQLTCESMEWIASQGGGQLIDAESRCDLTTPAVAAALDRAAAWAGGIAPASSTTDDLVRVQTRFLNGDAAFMRNWTYAWALVNAPDSNLAGKVVVAPLPKGPNGRAAVLGGWQLAVSRYSKYPELSRKLVVFLASEASQKRRAVQGGFFPARPALFTDPDVVKAVPHIRFADESMAAAILRPAKSLGGRYNEVSATLYTAANEVLARKRSSSEAADIIRRAVNESLRK